MTGPAQTNAFPGGALTGAAGLLLFALLAVVGARLTGMDGVAAVPPIPPQAVTRHLRFEDLADGTLRVSDAVSKQIVADLQSGSGGFVRGMMRALVRQRRLLGDAADAPFLLTRSADQRLVLADPVTGERIALEAFGSTNLAAFAALLDAPRDGASFDAGSREVADAARGEST